MIVSVITSSFSYSKKELACPPFFFRMIEMDSLRRARYCLPKLKLTFSMQKEFHVKDPFRILQSNDKRLHRTRE